MEYRKKGPVRMKKNIIIIMLLFFILSYFNSCNTMLNYTQTSWVDRLDQKAFFENEYLSAICAYVDKDSMTKNIAAEGINPFIYRDPTITKQESILLSLTIIPKADFTILAKEISIKTEVSIYPILFKEYIISENMYETSIDSESKKMKNFVQKYFISLKENYKINEKKTRFIYSIINYEYKGAIIRVPIHLTDGKLIVLNFAFIDIK
jgi:hypothetical protein